MTSLLRLIATVGTLTMFGATGPQAVACGFDRGLGDSFSAIHPKSLSVAFAISDAVATGQVNKAAAAPFNPDPKGYWRAAERIKRFQNLLARDDDRTLHRASIALLLIDSQLWARLTPGPSGYELQVHATSADPDDVVVLTNEAILTAVVEGELSGKSALDLGVMAIDGERKASELIATAITSVTSSQQAAPSIKSGPVPFFAGKPARSN